MDNITHAAFGALVGEATLGRKVGNKALGWGALAATIPDFDVLGNPFISAPAALEIHRGFTHALLFAPLAAPMLGYLVWRLYAGRGSPAAEVGWKGWSLLFLWGLLSHPVLDTLTIYGTQLFLPFSSYPATVSALFILDPLFMLLLIVGVVAVVRLGRDDRHRRFWAWGTLAASGVYVIGALAVKAHIEREVWRDLGERQIEADRLVTAPTPLNSLLRYVVVDADESMYVGYRGLFDPDEPMVLRELERRTWLLEPLEGARGVETLRWFSKDFFIVRPNVWRPEEELEPLGLVVHDLRFGKHDAHLGPGGHGRWVYSFHLARKPDGRITFRRPVPGFDVRQFSRLVRRISGDVSVHGFE